MTPTFVLTSIFDHLLELVIALAVVVVLAVVCLTVMGLCVFGAVFLAHAISRPNALSSYVAVPAFGSSVDPSYDEEEQGYGQAVPDTGEQEEEEKAD